MILSIYTDGGARGNPGPAAFGAVIKNGAEVLMRLGKYLGETTNNIAEYLAVVESLRWLSKHRDEKKITKANFFLDSQLVTFQLTGKYKVKHPGLVPLFQSIAVLRTQVAIPLTFTHIPREENKEADRVVNEILDAQENTL